MSRISAGTRRNTSTTGRTVPITLDGVTARRPAVMNAATRDAMIVMLRKRGLTHAAIAARVGMSRRGVSMALERIAEGRPGRVRSE